MIYDPLMNDRLRELMSGEWRGPVPAALRAMLRAASVGYDLAVRNRNARFDRGVGVARATVPVISIGNLTAGGTGKTPVVAFVANYLRARGANVAILSRGYRATDSASGNDEALVLEHLCPGMPHLQRADRVSAAADAVERNAAQALVLDDGFQHRRLARDLDIVLIDATNPFGYWHLLPRGLLREPIESLRRADVVLLTRADAVAASAKAEIIGAIQRVAPHVPIVEVAFPAASLINASGERHPLDDLREMPVLAFCGIGNPAGFAATLANAGLRTAELIPFRDHHHYTPADLERISRRAHARGVGAAVTTLKDLVKIAADVLPAPSGVPLWALETACELRTNGEALTARLDALLNRAVVSRAA